jgi:hypothetical protein
MATSEEDKVKELIALMERFGNKTKALGDAIDKLKLMNSQALGPIERANRERIAEADLIKKAQNEYRNLIKEQLEGTKTQREVNEELVKQRKAIRENNDLSAEQKAAMLAAIDTARLRGASEARAADASERYGKAVDTASKIFTPAMQAMSGVIKGISSNDQLATAGASLQGIASLTTDAISGVGKGASSVGTTLSTSLDPRLRGFGKALEVVGPLVSMLGNGLSKVASVAIPYLQGELSKFSQSFDQMSKIGAVFGDGLTGMVNASKDAGLTVTSFAKVLEQNREAIAQSGLGMVGGARLVGQVGKTLKDSGVQQGLMNLGYSLEDQAAMTADVISQMRKTSGRMLGAQEVAPAVAEYAKNMRLLSAITGEDVAAKTKAAEKANQELALQAQLTKMGVNQADFNQAMAGMTEQEQQNLRDRIIFGQVINQEGAQAESLNKAMGDKGQAIFQALQQGQLNAEKMTDINKDFGPAVKKGALALADTLGTAAVGTGDASLKALSKGQLDLINQANTFTDEAIANAKKNNKDALAGEDPTTKNLMAAKTAANDMAVSMQQVSLKAMPAFTAALKESTEAMKNTIEMFASGKTDWSGIAGTVGTAIAGVVGSIALSTVGALLKDKLLGGVTGGPGGGLLGSIKDMFTRQSSVPGVSGGPAAGGGPGLGGSVGPGGGPGGIIGSMADGISKVGPMLKSLGEGAGGMIGAVLKGIAEGLAAFAKPQILLGATILGASITVIGAGIAGAAWIMGKALPSLAEGLSSFATIDGDNLISVGKGVAALGASLAVFGAGGALGSIGNVFSSLVEGIGSLFGGKSQMEKIKEFANMGPGLTQAGEGLSKFTLGLKDLTSTDVGAIDKVTAALERLQKANEKGFGSRLMDKIFGDSTPTVPTATAMTAPAAGTTAANNIAITAPSNKMQIPGTDRFQMTPEVKAAYDEILKTYPANMAQNIDVQKDAYEQAMMEVKARNNKSTSTASPTKNLGQTVDLPNGDALIPEGTAATSATSTIGSETAVRRDAATDAKAQQQEMMDRFMALMESMSKDMASLLETSRAISDHTDRTARNVQ